jgi:hypothetical protein
MLGTFASAPNEHRLPILTGYDAIRLVYKANPLTKIASDGTLRHRHCSAPENNWPNSQEAGAELWRRG